MSEYPRWIYAADGTKKRVNNSGEEIAATDYRRAPYPPAPEPVVELPHDVHARKIHALEIGLAALQAALAALLQGNRQEAARALKIELPAEKPAARPAKKEPDAAS